MEKDLTEKIQDMEISELLLNTERLVKTIKHNKEDLIAALVYESHEERSKRLKLISRNISQNKKDLSLYKEEINKRLNQILSDKF